MSEKTYDKPITYQKHPNMKIILLYIGIFSFPVIAIIMLVFDYIDMPRGKLFYGMNIILIFISPFTCAISIVAWAFRHREIFEPGALLDRYHFNKVVVLSAVIFIVIACYIRR